MYIHTAICTYIYLHLSVFAFPTEFVAFHMPKQLSKSETKQTTLNIRIYATKNILKVSNNNSMRNITATKAKMYGSRNNKNNEIPNPK